MTNYFSSTIILFTFICTNIQIVCMETAENRAAQQLDVATFATFVAFHVTHQDECNALATSKTTWSALYKRLGYCHTQQQINSAFIAAVYQKDYPAVRYIFNKYKKDNKSAFSCITDRVCLGSLPRRIVLSPLCIADEPMKQLLEKLALPAMIKEKRTQPCMANTVSAQPSTLLCESIANNHHTIAQLLQSSVVKQEDILTVEHCLHIAIGNNITNPDQKMIELLFTNPFLQEKATIAKDLPYYITFAASKNIKNKPNYALETLKNIHASSQTLEAIQHWCHEMLKKDVRSESELAKWRKKIEDSGIAATLGQFLLACIANDCNQAFMLLNTPEVTNAIENNKNIIAMCLYPVVKNNIENKDQSLIQLLFTNGWIIKHVLDYDALAYINFAESESKKSTTNQVLPILKNLHGEYLKIKASDMFNSLQVYAKHLANFQLNKKNPVENNQSAGLMSWAWNAGSAVVQRGATVVQYGAQRVVECGTSAVLYGSQIAYNGFSSITGFALYTYNDLPSTIYNSFPTIRKTAAIEHKDSRA